MRRSEHRPNTSVARLLLALLLGASVSCAEGTDEDLSPGGGDAASDIRLVSDEGDGQPGAAEGIGPSPDPGAITDPSSLADASGGPLAVPYVPPRPEEPYVDRPFLQEINHTTNELEAGIGELVAIGGKGADTYAGRFFVVRAPNIDVAVPIRVLGFGFNCRHSRHRRHDLDEGFRIGRVVAEPHGDPFAVT